MVNKSQLLNIYSWFINHIFCGFIRHTTFLILESRNGAERVGLEGGIKAAQVLRILNKRLPKVLHNMVFNHGYTTTVFKNAVNKPCVIAFQL